MDLGIFTEICNDCDCLVEYVSPVEACINLMGDSSNLEDFKYAAAELGVLGSLPPYTVRDCKVYFTLESSYAIRSVFNKVSPLFIEVIKNGFYYDESEVHKELNLVECGDEVKISIKFENKVTLEKFKEIWDRYSNNYPELYGVLCSVTKESGLYVLWGKMSVNK